MKTLVTQMDEHLLRAVGSLIVHREQNIEHCDTEDRCKIEGTDNHGMRHCDYANVPSR